jgi:dienelactone hydrolase
MLKKYVVIFLMMVVMMVLAVPASADILGPGQPADGPGGSDYAYAGVKKETRGLGINKYIIYEPYPKADAPLPVIAFMHGYTPLPTPKPNLDFIHHLVKKGHIVIWPYYMVFFTLPQNFDRNAGNAVSAALDHIIGNTEHAQPEYDNTGLMNFALMGHSAGGITAANLAATYDAYNLDPPKALVCFLPGRGRLLAVPIRDYSQIPADIYMQIIVATEDDIAMDHGSYIWNNSPQISNMNKDWILVKSDYYGYPDANDLIADHYSNLGRPYFSLDALDWYGYWKWATALCNLAFYNFDGAYALGNTSEQRYMGLWSDGQAVIEPEVSDFVNFWH